MRCRFSRANPAPTAGKIKIQAHKGTPIIEGQLLITSPKNKEKPPPLKHGGGKDYMLLYASMIA